MNSTDVCILIGIVLFVAVGFRDGFLKKIFTSLGFLGGLIFATKYTPDLAERLSAWLNFSQDTSIVMAFFIIFMFIMISVNLFYRWFGQTGSETLKIWSRLGGGVLGVAQGALSVSLVLLLLDVFDIPTEETKQESLFYEEALQVAPNAFDYTTSWMPDSKRFYEEIRDKIEKYKNPR